MLKELSHAKNEVLCHALIHLQHEMLIHIPVAVAVGKTAATSERETQKNWRYRRESSRECEKNSRIERHDTTSLNI